MSRLLSGFSCRNLFRTSQYNMVAVKLARSCQSSRTAMGVLVKECRPGWGAQVSKPQAAMVSVMLLHWPSAGALLAAAQQTRSKRTSDSACSNMVRTAYHCRYGDFGSPVLSIVSMAKSEQENTTRSIRAVEKCSFPHARHNTRWDRFWLFLSHYQLSKWTSDL